MTPLNGSSFLQSYIEQNKTLARTLVIKSGTSANVLNDFLTLKYGSNAVNPDDPTSWKYYLNISGSYHSTDSPMMITSLDTLEIIQFTKDNLKIHTATAEAYAYGSRYYYSIINKYPTQEQLVLGVLYPVDINLAIAADEGSILGFPSSLVEPQEQTLIHELELFIKSYLTRWNVPAFGLSDTLYNASYHALMYLAVLPKLLNLRLKRCKTVEAHSFHIREYLDSHGALSQYIPYLTLKQAMFLYRNIRYLDRNAGKQSTFNTLVQNLLTERRIPISAYTVRHHNVLDNKLYPVITARRKPLNGQYNVAETSYVTMDELYAKESLLVYGNQRYLDAHKTDMNLSFMNSNSSVIQTKELESNMVDYNDAVPDTLTAVLTRQWAYMAAHGLYTAVINFLDPVTGEGRSLRAKDALIYMVYINCMSLNIQMETIPNYLNLKARKGTLPSIAELVSITDSYYALTDVATDIITNQPLISKCSSTTQFFNLSNALYEESKRHWYIVSNTHDLNRRGYIAAMVQYLYEDEFITLNDGTYATIFEWLRANNLPDYNFTYSQAQGYVQDIFIASTGMSIDNTKMLKYIQQYLIALMQEMCSYTVQTIREINNNNIIPLNWSANRVGNFQYSADQSLAVDTGLRIVDNYKSSDRQITVSTLGTDVTDIIESISLTKVQITTVPTITTERAIEETHDVPLGNFYIGVTYSGYDPIVSNTVAYIGKEFYNSLTDSQKQQLVSIY